MTRQTWISRILFHKFWWIIHSTGLKINLVSVAAVFIQVVWTSYSQRSELLTQLRVVHCSSPNGPEYRRSTHTPPDPLLGFNSFNGSVVSSDIQLILLTKTRTIRVRATDRRSCSKSFFWSLMSVLTPRSISTVSVWVCWYWCTPRPFAVVSWSSLVFAAQSWRWAWYLCRFACQKNFYDEMWGRKKGGEDKQRSCFP